MKLCMVVPNPMVKGGIASVVNGYRGSELEKQYEITYVESYTDGGKFKKLIKALKGYGTFARTLRKNRPDIVHIHSSFGPSFYRKIPFMLMAKRKNIPIVNHIHGADFEAFYDRAKDRKKKLVRKIYMLCDQTIVLSDEWKEKIGRIIPDERINVVENYSIIPENIDFNAKRKGTVLFMGELGTRKGCFDIPDIIAEVKDQYDDVRITMAGAGQVRELEDCFEKRGLKDVVSFPGWVRGNDKDKLLRENSILLFPSYNEGMPMTVLEAMAYGMYVVTTNVGGIPKLISQGNTGYIENPGDIDAMVDDILKLLISGDGTSPAADMGKRAREFVIANYSLERHIEKLSAVYSKCLC